ncbi:hypothetical protein FACS189499_03920 [Clostridia bacterium]|nr:hypothetical protein FACS189499_03920 [Clostridia bacterium]
MNIKELLGDLYSESMTPEEIIKALEGVKSPEKEPATPATPPTETQQDYEAKRLKDAVTKANKEAAEYKRQLQARMTEDERREAERKQKEEEINETLAQLQRDKVIADTKSQFLALGYEAALAERAATAAADGDFGSMFIMQKQHLDAVTKQLRAEILKNTPKPNVGTQIPKDVTKEQFGKLAYTDRLNLKRENPELYNELNGGT